MFYGLSFTLHADGNVELLVYYSNKTSNHIIKLKKNFYYIKLMLEKKT